MHQHHQQLNDMDAETLSTDDVSSRLARMTIGTKTATMIFLLPPLSSLATQLSAFSAQGTVSNVDEADMPGWRYPENTRSKINDLPGTALPLDHPLRQFYSEDGMTFILANWTQVSAFEQLLWNGCRPDEDCSRPQATLDLRQELRAGLERRLGPPWTIELAIPWAIRWTVSLGRLGPKLDLAVSVALVNQFVDPINTDSHGFISPCGDATIRIFKNPTMVFRDWTTGYHDRDREVIWSLSVAGHHPPGACSDCVALECASCCPAGGEAGNRKLSCGRLTTWFYPIPQPSHVYTL